MSMPSSSDEVATTQGRRPAFRSSSMPTRCSRATDPWWARATTTSWASSGSAPAWSAARSVASSFRWLHSRSASRRELQNTIVDRWDSTRSRTRACTAGQIDVRVVSAPAAGPEGASSTTLPSSAMSGTGTTTWTSTAVPPPASTISTGRAVQASSSPGVPPPRKRATSDRGRWVADRPMRWGAGRPAASTSASSRSSESARCAPRLVPATACTSSTITVSMLPSVSRARDVSSRNSDSGVVIRMSAGWRAWVRRSRADVSPERIATSTGCNVAPAASAWRRMPTSGARRLRSTSYARAFSGDRYSTRVPPASAGGPCSSRSSDARNAASVLPDPVGALTRTCAPAAIPTQAPRCAGVGSGKLAANQARVAAPNGASGSVIRPA